MFVVVYKITNLLNENDIPQSKIVAFAVVLNTTPEYLMGWDSKNNHSQGFNDDEKKLVESYRELNDADKNFILGMISRLNFNRTSAEIKATI